MNKEVDFYAKFYLPFEVEACTSDGVFKIAGFSDDLGIFLDTIMYGAHAIPKYQLLLRPLPLTKTKIVHKGNVFCPMVELQRLYPNAQWWLNYRYVWVDNNVDLSGTCIEHCIMVKLMEWGFDVFALLARGLAIEKIN